MQRTIGAESRNHFRGAHLADQGCIKVPRSIQRVVESERAIRYDKPIARAVILSEAKDARALADRRFDRRAGRRDRRLARALQHRIQRLAEAGNWGERRNIAVGDGRRRRLTAG